MSDHHVLLTHAFRSLSARLGQDPLQVQGPGGNTSIKDAETMWIKASGTELARAEAENIFVAVDRQAAVAEAQGRSGNGDCKTTVLDATSTLRPSIETTFHAVLDHVVVAHTHSVATLVHAISPEGRAACGDKLAGLPFVMVPYAKPGLPLTRKILEAISNETQVIILQNHGLICCGGTVDEVSGLIGEVERRLSLPVQDIGDRELTSPAPAEFVWADESWIAFDRRTRDLVAAGSYYPDHVVFLGPGLPDRDHAGHPPAIIHEGEGIALRADATPAQKAMLRCLSDVLIRLPYDWSAEAIGLEAEAELMNWDAEKYRQSLAAEKS
ncbi:MAG: class II aldolase/adducin family protein [Pseudomonadota bacterium]